MHRKVGLARQRFALALVAATACAWVGACSSTDRNFGSNPTATGGDDAAGASALASGGSSTGGRTSPEGGAGATSSAGSGITNVNGGAASNEGVAGAGGSGPLCGAETNFKTDAHNCGVCGHDCLGGDCMLAQCQPVEIAKNQGRTFTIAVDASFIYWGGDGSVIAKKSIDNTGKVIELVPAAAHESSYASVLVSQTLYWGNDWKDNGVRGCALPACASGPQTLISGTTPIRDLIYAETAGTLYYTQGSSLWQKSLPSGTAQQLAPATNPAFALATDGAFVYWSEHLNKTSIIRKVTTGGTGVVTVASQGLAYVNGLGVRENALFVLEYPRNDGTDRDARILKVPLPAGVGAGDPPLFAPAGLGAEKMVVDDSGVYWTQHDGDPYTAPGATSVRYCPLSGCVAMPERLATTDQAWGITTDDKAVYWTTETGLVMKVAK